MGVFVVAGILLASIGGLGVVAAPVTLSLLLVVVRRHPSRPFRVAGAVVGGLTAAELAWASSTSWPARSPWLSGWCRRRQA